MSASPAGLTPPREALLSAPAKLNLRLEVLGRRADGWHELWTVMQALELHDRLRVRRVERAGVELRLSGPQAEALPTDGTNLAARAAVAVLAAGEAALRARWGSAVGLALELDKQVPAEAGLGGGSADAAAAWLGAERVLGLALGPAVRREALAALGSDCVFFAEVGASGLALCRGRGELVAPLACEPGAHAVARGAHAFALLTPQVRCPTGEVYRAAEFPSGPVRSAPALPIEHFGGSALEVGCLLGNELEAAACTVRPELSRWRELLDEDEDARWVLSGSGSSWFALLPDQSTARRTLASAVERARARGLAVRAAHVTRPGPGPRFLQES